MQFVAYDFQSMGSVDTASKFSPSILRFSIFILLVEGRFSKKDHVRLNIYLDHFLSIAVLFIGVEICKVDDIVYI